jgi:hypothetical protein
VSGAQTKSEEPSDTVKLALYKAARDEMIERQKMRDTATLAYIAGIGAYAGFINGGTIKALTPAAEALLNLILPIVCVVFSLIVIQHHIMIGKLTRYVKEQIHFGDFPHWDQSSALSSGADHTWQRTVAQALVLIVPLASNAFYGWRHRADLLSIHLDYRAEPDASVVVCVITLLADALVASAVICWHFDGWFSRRQTDRATATRKSFLRQLVALAAAIGVCSGVAAMVAAIRFIGAPHVARAIGFFAVYAGLAPLVGFGPLRWAIAWVRGVLRRKGESRAPSIVGGAVATLLLAFAVAPWAAAQMSPGQAAHDGFLEAHLLPALVGAAVGLAATAAHLRIVRGGRPPSAKESDDLRPSAQAA